MSAPTFKVGDRVRTPGGMVGIVTPRFHGSWIQIEVTHAFGKWTRWIDPLGCTPAPPMSPEAKMVWHAMRAGAKRIGRYHWSSTDGTTYRTHKYEDPSCNRVYLRVDIALPPLAEDEAGR